MRQTTATVMQKTIEYDLSRRPLPLFASSGTITGTFIPTGGQIVQKQYGQEYSGEFEFYTKKRHAGLIAGNRLKIGSAEYDIVAARDYGKAITLLLVVANG